MTIPCKEKLHLWIAELKSITHKSMFSRYLTWLSDDEKARYSTFTDLESKNHYLLARALLRYSLSYYFSDIKPGQWVFSTNSAGKPYLLHPKMPIDLAFNVSHANGVVCIAFSQKFKVGIDIESVIKFCFDMDFARHYYTRLEYKELATLPHEKALQRIAELWVLKEAYLKLLGTGIGAGHVLRKFSFHFNKDADLELKIESCMGSNSMMPNIWLFNYGKNSQFRIAIAQEACDLVEGKNYSVDAFQAIPGFSFNECKLTPASMMLAGSIHKRRENESL